MRRFGEDGDSICKSGFSKGCRITVTRAAMAPTTHTLTKRTKKTTAKKKSVHQTQASCFDRTFQNNISHTYMTGENETDQNEERLSTFEGKVSPGGLLK